MLDGGLNDSVRWQVFLWRWLITRWRPDEGSYTRAARAACSPMAFGLCVVTACVDNTVGWLGALYSTVCLHSGED